MKFHQLPPDTMYRTIRPVFIDIYIIILYLNFLIFQPWNIEVPYIKLTIVNNAREI